MKIKASYLQVIPNTDVSCAQIVGYSRSRTCLLIFSSSPMQKGDWQLGSSFIHSWHIFKSLRLNLQSSSPLARLPNIARFGYRANVILLNLKEYLSGISRHYYLLFYNLDKQDYYWYYLVSYNWSLQGCWHLIPPDPEWILLGDSTLSNTSKAQSSCFPMQTSTSLYIARNT